MTWNVALGLERVTRAAPRAITNAVNYNTSIGAGSHS